MSTAERLSLANGLNAGLRAAMAADEKVVLLGEDIGALGGVFRITEGLQGEFGEQRVIDTPLAESGIVGTAVGLALRGYRPVVEMQFDGFVYPAFDQITSQVAKLHYRSAGRLRLPMTIRIPCGGGIGAVEHHSESNETYFAHTPGLRVVICATPADGYWMMRQAIESDDPVVFFEPKRRYHERSSEPAGFGEAPELGLHQARVVRPGADVTVLCYGAMVGECLAAAQAAAEEGHELEVIDLRSLSPLDVDTITASVQRTGRVVVVHEAQTFLGLGAELAALLQERCFGSLKAPVLRVGGYNVPYPVSRLEGHFLPDLDRILDAVDRTLAY